LTLHHIKNKKLPYPCKPTSEQVIEIMQSKIYCYQYIRRYFPHVSAYPEMIAWLENAEDAPSDLEIWRVERAQYAFVDFNL
jgi:hypothetical protein